MTTLPEKEVAATLAHDEHHADYQDEALVAAAMRGKAAEESMTLGQAFRWYKSALFCSFIVSMNIVMESYATILVSLLVVRATPWGHVGRTLADTVFQAQFVLRLPHVQQAFWREAP